MNCAPDPTGTKRHLPPRPPIGLAIGHSSDSSLRQHPLGIHRITFDPAKPQVVIQREEFRALTFLERMHRRRGYDQPYVLEDTWGLSVDVAVAAMVFWSLSGIWLWWELKATRGWGTLSMRGGWALFAIFLLLL